MALISIVVGLAIGDLATSFHKLIRHRRAISWDLRTPLAAALGFIVLFSMWFDMWTIHRRPEILAYPFLLSLVVEFVLLFLMATSVLPDDPHPGLDLAEYYEDNARSIWIFFLLFQASYVSHWLFFILSSPTYSLGGLVMRLPETLGVPALAIALVLTPRRKKLHLVLVSVLLIYWIINFWDSTIAG